MTVLMSMGRLLYVYILLMGSATGAVNARFLIHEKQINPYANSSLLSRYLTCVVSKQFNIAFEVLI
jgi:hypothetical protein